MEFDENLNPINQDNKPDWSHLPSASDSSWKDDRPTQNTTGQTPPQNIPHSKPKPSTPPSKEDTSLKPEILTFQPEESNAKPPLIKSSVTGLIIAVILLTGVAITAIVLSNKPPAFLPITSGSELGLTVTGSGEVYATPDVAKIDFAVRTESKNIADSQKANSETIAKIKNELARFAIDPKDIKTLRYTIKPNYDYFPARNPRLKGYNTYHSLRITIRKLEDTDAIVQTLGNAGITEIGQIRFTVDDLSEIQGEAREQAIAQAKEKAQQLANLSDAKLGKIISIKESTLSPNDWPYPRIIDGMGGGVEIGLEEGIISVTSTVTITYSLD